MTQFLMLSISGSFVIPTAIIGIAIAMVAVLVFVSKNYHRCSPNEVLVITGRKHKMRIADGQEVEKGFRFVTGGAAFVYPILESVKRLHLVTFSVPFAIKSSPNKDGVPVNVEALANVKISSVPELLANAVERLLGKTEEDLESLSNSTLEGQLRQIVGTLTVEDLITDREAISKQVLNVAQMEMNKLGLEIVNFVIQKVGDDVEYISSLGKKRTAEVQRDAQIGEAEAQREATIRSSEAKKLGEQKRLANDAEIAEAQRDLALKQAEFKKATEAAQAEADLARELKSTEIQSHLAQKKVQVEQAEVTAQIQVAEQQQLLTEKQLVATTIKPAEAERQAAIIRAESQRQAAIIEAEGASQSVINLAEGEAAATKAKAEAEKVKLSLEGEGRAAAAQAEAKAVKAQGEAQADARRASLLAEAEGVRQGGLAEAESLLKKNEAMEKMGQAAQLIVILEKLPSILPSLGEAGERIVGAAFTPVGEGLSRIGTLHMVDMGNGQNGNSPLSRLAMSVPNTVFGLLQGANALGIDFSGFMSKLGVSGENMVGATNTSTEAPVIAPPGPTLPVQSKKEVLS